MDLDVHACLKSKCGIDVVEVRQLVPDHPMSRIPEHLGSRSFRVNCEHVSEVPNDNQYHDRAPG